MANLITVGRLGLLFVALGLLYSGSFVLTALVIPLSLLVFLADGIDGWVARRRGSDNQLGAVLDVAGDRIVENAYWIVFAQLGLVPVAFPLLVVTRGFWVDALRSVSYRQGKTPFGATSMMRSPAARWITGSRFMRGLYGAAKAVAFCYLASEVAVRLGPAELPTSLAWQAVRLLGWGMVYLTIALTIVRGLPVIVESYSALRGQS